MISCFMFVPYREPVAIDKGEFASCFCGTRKSQAEARAGINIKTAGSSLVYNMGASLSFLSLRHSD